MIFELRSLFVGILIGLCWYFIRQEKKRQQKQKEEAFEKKREHQKSYSFHVIGHTEDGRPIGMSYGGVYVMNKEQNWWDRIGDSGL